MAMERSIEDGRRVGVLDPLDLIRNQPGIVRGAMALLRWKTRLTSLTLLAVAAGCNGSAPGVTCPPGQIAIGGSCRPAVTCGAGTRLVDDKCVPSSDDGGLYCGPGTERVGDECLPGTPLDAQTADSQDLATASQDAGAQPDAAVLPDAALAGDLSPSPDLLALPPSNEIAVAYQIDSTHSGGQPATSLKPALSTKWSVNLAGDISYAVVIPGAVYVTVGQRNKGAQLYALDIDTGLALWGPIDIGGGQFAGFANATYDGGKIFVVNGAAVVTEYDAVTGAAGWSRLAGDDTFSGPPTARAGMVYVSVQGLLSALDEQTGAVIWSVQAGGSPTTPSVDDDALILDYICGGVSAFAPLTGMKLWSTAPTCVGGGGDMAVIYAGQIFAMDFTNEHNLILGEAQAMPLGTFNASAPPAFENGVGFLLSKMTLTGQDLKGNVMWSFAADGTLASPPLAAGGYVYIGSTKGNLYALEETTGKQVWTAALGSPVATANQTDGQSPFTGLTVAQGRLFVPAGQTLTVFGN